MMEDKAPHVSYQISDATKTIISYPSIIKENIMIEDAMDITWPKVHKVDDILASNTNKRIENKTKSKMKESTMKNKK
jgi:hypothetical protein